MITQSQGRVKRWQAWPSLVLSRLGYEGILHNSFAGCRLSNDQHEVMNEYNTYCYDHELLVRRQFQNHVCHRMGQIPHYGKYPQSFREYWLSHAVIPLQKMVENFNAMRNGVVQTMAEKVTANIGFESRIWELHVSFEAIYRDQRCSGRLGADVR